MVIWPVSSLRVANRAQQRLYEALQRDGATTALLPEMQTRSELYQTIGLGEFEALDKSIIASAAPNWAG
nr:methylisocitrate lyase [Tritonibacter sp. AK171]